LNGGGVGDKSSIHLYSLGRHVTDGRLDVIRDPRHERLGVSVLDGQHGGVYVLGGDLAAEDARGGEVFALTRIAVNHHIARIEHLLRELMYGELAESFGAGGRYWSESGHEEVKSRERDQVDGHLAKIGIQLTWETEAASHAGHDVGDQVVEVAVLGLFDFQRRFADIVQSLVIEATYGVGVFDELM
jgi:hypothetical protein